MNRLTTPVAPHTMLLTVFQYQKMGRDQRAVRQRIFEIVNFVNMVSQLPSLEPSGRKWPFSRWPLSKVYKPLRTFIALVGLEIWSNRDLISITPPAGNNLDAFMKWRNSELLERKKHDNAHLIRSEQTLFICPCSLYFCFVLLLFGLVNGRKLQSRMFTSCNLLMHRHPRHGPC